MSGDSNRSVSFTVMVKDAATATLKQISHAAGEVTSKLFSFKDVVKGLSEAFLVFKLTEVIKDIVELGITSDKTFRGIAAALPTFTDGIGELKEGLEQLANSSGRALESIHALATEIAQSGVANAADLLKTAEASTRLADAAGGLDPKEMAQMLIQTRREFHLTSDDLMGVAAEIADVSRTAEVGVRDFNSVLLASTPAFLKFGINADEGIRALGALAAAGYKTPRALRSALSDLDAGSIRQWANQITVGTDALEQLIKRSDEYRARTEATGQILKNEFSETLEKLGSIILPLVNGGLIAVTESLRRLKEQKVGAEAGDLMNPGNLFRAAETWDANHGATGVWGGPEKSKPPHIATVSEKKAAESAAERIALQQEEIDKLKALNDAYGESELTIKELTIAYEALKEKQQHAKEVNESVRAALDAGSDALADQKTRALELAVAHGLLESALNKITAALGQTTVAGQNAAAVTKDIIAVDDLLNQGKADLPGILARNNAIIKQQTDDLNKKLDENQQKILKVASAWASVGRSAIAAAQAIGKMDSATAAALQNAVSLGEGLAKLYASGGKEGGVESVASLGGLIASISDMGHAASRAQQQAAELAQTIGKLFTGLENEIHGSGSLDARLAAGTSEYADARNSIERNLGGKAHEAEREAALARLNALEAVRLQQIKDEYAIDQARMKEDFLVRDLRAAGRTKEADDLAFMLAQQREYADALKGGADAATLAALASTQLAEANARQANAALQAFSDANQAEHAGTLAAMNAKITADNQAREDQKQAAQDQLSVLQEIASTTDKQLNLQQQTVDGLRKTVDLIHNFTAGLKINPALTYLSPIEQLNEAKRQFDAQVAIARGGGAAGQAATANLPALAQAVLEASHAENASGPGFVQDENAIIDTMDSLESQYGQQLDVQQQILSVLQYQSAQLNAQIAILNAQLHQSAYDAALARQTYVVGSAKDPNFGAMNGVIQDMSHGPGGGFSDTGAALGPIYAYPLGGTQGLPPWDPNSPAGQALAAAMGQAAGAASPGMVFIPGQGWVNPSSPDNAWMLNPDNDSPTILAALHAAGYPGFARGTNNFVGGMRIVGELGPEMELTGPSRIIPTEKILAAMSGGGSANAEVLSELKAMRAELQAIVRVSAAGANGTIDQLQELNAKTHEQTKKVQQAADAAVAARAKKVS